MPDPEGADEVIWAKLRRSGRLHRNPLGAWLAITPAALEAATGGVLHFEVEHATAGGGDCAWRLRERGSDRPLFRVYDVREGVDWCR